MWLVSDPTAPHCMGGAKPSAPLHTASGWERGGVNSGASPSALIHLTSPHRKVIIIPYFSRRGGNTDCSSLRYLICPAPRSLCVTTRGSAFQEQVEKRGCLLNSYYLPSISRLFALPPSSQKFLCVGTTQTPTSTMNVKPEPQGLGSLIT